MPSAQSLAKILLHMVFSTKEQRPFLKDQALREELSQIKLAATRPGKGRETALR